jgi:hydroxymethylbilane synthase
MYVTAYPIHPLSGSQLAMVQTMWVKAQLEQRHASLSIEVHGMTTAGDTILNQPLSAFSEKVCHKT